jgi:hypothetical protein
MTGSDARLGSDGGSAHRHGHALGAEAFVVDDQPGGGSD